MESCRGVALFLGCEPAHGSQPGSLKIRPRAESPRVGGPHTTQSVHSNSVQTELPVRYPTIRLAICVATPPALDTPADLLSYPGRPNPATLVGLQLLEPAAGRSRQAAG